MSVRVMSLVWQLELPDSQKIVLLALADSANDEGHCWPSMRSLVAKCSKGERTIQGVIKQLCDAGHLTRREVLGKGCNYTVHPRRECAPAENAPPPAEVAGHPRSRCGQTVKEPSKNRKSAAPARGIDQVGLPEGVEEQVWADFVTLRKRQRAPITPTVMKTIGDEATRANWTLSEALTECVARSWRGFKADWVEARAAAAVGAKAMTPAETAAFYRKIGREDEAEEIEQRERRRQGSGPARPIGELIRKAANG